MLTIFSRLTVSESLAVDPISERMNIVLLSYILPLAGFLSYGANVTFKYGIGLSCFSRGISPERIFMADDDKKFSKQIIGKTVVSKAGKRFGEVGDVIFETRSGELIHIVLTIRLSMRTSLNWRRIRKEMY